MCGWPLTAKTLIYLLSCDNMFQHASCTTPRQQKSFEISPELANHHGSYNLPLTCRPCRVLPGRVFSAWLEVDEIIIPFSTHTHLNLIPLFQWQCWLMAFLLRYSLSDDRFFRCTILSWILNLPGFRAKFWNPRPTLFICIITLSTVKTTTRWVKLAGLFLKLNFWGEQAFISY